MRDKLLKKAAAGKFKASRTEMLRDVNTRSSRSYKTPTRTKASGTSEIIYEIPYYEGMTRESCCTHCEPPMMCQYHGGNWGGDWYKGHNITTCKCISGMSGPKEGKSK